MMKRVLLRSPRTGFTVIELLVSIVIIGLLVALLLPAIGNVRSTARRTQCLSQLHNLAIAMHDNEQVQQRLPASGNWGHDAAMNSYPLHTWAVTLLPHLEQGNLFNQWDRDKPLDDPQNEPLTRALVPVFVCPEDLSATGKGDLSYSVNGGIGYTNKHPNGTRDVPVDSENRSLDLNGDGIFPHDAAQPTTSPTDREIFKRMGLFFMETWNTQITKRHHALADVHDGTSQTIMLAENVRVGADPLYARGSFANPDPARCAFYLPDPCRDQTCRPGHVDYASSNSGNNQINDGVKRPEGLSTIPNSFHTGGVNVAMADGSVRFLKETIDGEVYAALLSPQGAGLTGLPLAQVVVNEF